MVKVHDTEKADKTELLFLRKKIESEYATAKNFYAFQVKTQGEINANKALFVDFSKKYSDELTS